MTASEWSAGIQTSLTIVVYEEAPPEEGRKAYVDGDGNAVYLITSENMRVDSADYAAFLPAWGSNLGDANYNVSG